MTIDESWKEFKEEYLKSLEEHIMSERLLFSLKTEFRDNIKTIKKAHDKGYVEGLKHGLPKARKL